MTTEAERRILDGSAWREFCRALERAGEVVLRAETPTDAFDRAEGYRYLTRLLRAGLESQVEYADPRFPGFFQLANETIKIGNDNPDNVYRNANVSGRYRYRIWGTRGDAPILSFGTKGGGYEMALCYAVLSICIMAVGPGSLSLDRLFFQKAALNA